MSWLTFRAVPEPPLPHVVREKLAHWTAHGDDYDVLFLGSSRIKNHIIPQRFDELLDARGCHLKSFNFGIAAMHAPENNYVLDLILAQSHQRLRWVFVEIDFIDGAPQEDEKGTLRGLYWHDWERLQLVGNCVWCPHGDNVWQWGHDVRVRLADFCGHLFFFGERMAGLGRGADRLATYEFHLPPQPLDPKALGPLNDGWVAAVPKKADLKDLASGRVQKDLDECLAHPPFRDEGDRSSQTALLSLTRKIVAAGATPVFVIPPRICRSYFYPQACLARQYPIVNLCDPIGCPALYQQEVRVDASHLNAKGAEAITRIVVEKSAPFLGARSAAPF